MTKPRTNWSSTPRSARKRPILEGVTLAPEVLTRLNDHCAETGEKKSVVVEEALRVHLRMPPA